MNRLWSLSVSFCLLLGGVQADSLWREGSTLALADHTASSVGDLLTVLVRESNSSTKNQTKKTKKEAGIDAGISSFLFSPGASSALTKRGQMPALSAKMATDFDGGGQINNSDSITSRFTVRVVDVLPNGNLLLEGRRVTTFSGETTTIVMRATVRKADVTPENSVYSFQLADLTLRYEGKGSVNDSQNRGWFGKFWDKVNPL